MSIGLFCSSTLVLQLRDVSTTPGTHISDGYTRKEVFHVEEPPGVHNIITLFKILRKHWDKESESCNIEISHCHAFGVLLADSPLHRWTSFMFYMFTPQDLLYIFIENDVHIYAADPDFFCQGFGNVFDL